ncbi:MAG: hypothetical protein M3066_10750 [Actinomycetota bacterium]|nr:hypothetical protein [Actinomycetota bacterium]
MSPGSYQLHGLRVRSEVPLHALPLADDGNGFDLDIFCGLPAPVGTGAPPGEVVAELTVAGSRYYTATRTAENHVFRTHGWGDFVIDVAARTIECRIDDKVAPEFISVLLGGTITAFYLGLAGRSLLHGSAVETDGVCTAFVGHSGAGKSTMAATMCAAGGRLVCDDVLHLDLERGAHCLGRSSELRLRQTSLSVLDGMDPMPSIRKSPDGKVAIAFEVAPPGDLELSRIVIPLPSRTNDTVELRRLRGAEAFMGLSRYPRILGWRTPEVLQARLVFLAALSERVPVFEAVLPWGPPFSGALASELLDCLDAAT